MAGAPSLPTAVSWQLQHSDVNGAGSLFQLIWKVASEGRVRVAAGCRYLFHSRAVTPQVVRPALELKAICPRSIHRGSVFVFIGSCLASSLPPTCGLFILLLSRLCFCASLHLPSPLHAQHPLPCSSLLLLFPSGSKLLGPSSSPSQPAWQQSCPQGTVIRLLLSRRWLL